jgi:hypothetical protein
MSLRTSALAALLIGGSALLASDSVQAMKSTRPKAQIVAKVGWSAVRGVKLHLVRPAQATAGFKANSYGVPSSGTYRQNMPPGSLTMWNVFHYQEVRPGVFLIRDTSGGGRPNAFDHGTVVTEFDMYKKLVETGAIRP